MLKLLLLFIASGFYFDKFRDLFTMYEIFISENWLSKLFCLPMYM